MGQRRLHGMEVDRDESPQIKGEAARRAFEVALRRSRREGMCRRGCSTTHNPVFHSTRVGVKIQEPKKQGELPKKRTIKAVARARLNKLNMGIESMMPERPISLQEEQLNFEYTARDSPIKNERGIGMT